MRNKEKNSLKRRVSKIYLLTSMLCIVLPTLINAQKFTNKSMQNEEYSFSILPGEQKWIDLKTTQARAIACQIPDYKLTTISTENLVRLCLDYPFFIEILSCRSMSQCFDKLFPTFNGFAELFSRSNCAEKILEKYQEIIAIHEENNNPSKHNLELYFIETMLIKYTDLNALSNQENNILNPLILQSLELKLSKKQFYGIQSLSNTAYIIANTNEKLIMTVLNRTELEEINKGQNYLPSEIFSKLHIELKL